MEHKPDAKIWLSHGGDSGGGSSETIPTGINRIDAEGVVASATIAQTIVAIIDTGIDLDHP